MMEVVAAFADEQYGSFTVFGRDGSVYRCGMTGGNWEELPPVPRSARRFEKDKEQDEALREV